MWPVVSGVDDWCGGFGARKNGGSGRPPKYPFRDMEIGEEFQVQVRRLDGKKSQWRAANAAYAIGRKYGMEFSARKVSDTEITITRTA